MHEGNNQGGKGHYNEGIGKPLALDVDVDRGKQITWDRAFIMYYLLVIMYYLVL